VMANTPRTDKPATTTSSTTTMYKGIVREKEVSAFTIKTGETVVEITVDKNTRFFKQNVQEKPAVTRTKPVETSTTIVNKTKDTGTKQNSAEATAVKGTKAETTERDKGTPAESSALSGLGTEVTFNEVVVGCTVAVQTDGVLASPLAKIVVIATSRVIEPKPIPVKLSTSGIIVSVDEAKFTFVMKPTSGDVMSFIYDKQTTFSILGSASLKADMHAEVIYLAEAVY